MAFFIEDWKINKIGRLKNYIPNLSILQSYNPTPFAASLRG